MAIKSFRPTSPGRRFATVSTFQEITKTEPEKSLLAPLKKKQAAIIRAGLPFGTAVVATNAITESSISAETRMAFLQLLQPLNMILTALQISPCSIMQTARNVIYWPPMA